ncbi:cullin-associated and neddylation-dissociated 1 isoform X1 [Dermatophagoides farinae]|uniref:Cullin-associated nedd8-dissociated protein 1-like n=1 Tax=Dermatophagoides farinae TaxID=6954 RepID=A0A9D4NSC3_DERFA|nr:cullin-associated NEDD8-dissociated protein 1-like [Dermatophagoides farinae]KAH7637047.1 cullin-associated nedd8-dissociated protein 1-like [Dermatophagoides farinae]
MATPNNSYQISVLIQKMSSADKDFRFMATNDLLNELQNDSIKLDDDAERKIVKTLLGLLKDNNAEVQNLAVKCLGPLVNKIKEQLAENVVDALCENILSSDEVLKETSSIGLKTVISEISIDSKSLVSTICIRITSKLIIALNSLNNNCSVQIDVLDIFSDLIIRFGHVLSMSYPALKDSLLPLLNNGRNSISKRTINCLAGMSITCNDHIYKEIIEYLLVELNQCDNVRAKIYINCLTAICKHSGTRISPYIDTIVALNEKFLQRQEDELIEACLLLFEIFVRRCPQEINPHLQKIITVCVKYISYDPNYNYDDNDDEDMEMDNDVDEYNGEDDYEEYSDEDDMSWKVRRASAKTLETIILNRLDLLEEFYQLISPTIIMQFREREENVKVDIFNTYIALLRQTRALVTNSENNEKFKQILKDQVPKIVRSLDRQLKEKSIKTRQCCFALLSELVQILPNALADPINEADEKKNYLNNIIPGILYSLNSNNSSSSMKIEALAFLNILFKNHDAQVFQNYFNALITEIRKAVSDDFYKISGEALIVLTELVQIIRPSLSIDSNVIDSNSGAFGYLDTLYSMTYDKLKASDVDLEVKESAINCMAQIICTFGDHMNDEYLFRTFALFLERLKNETTRLTCVRALIKITSVSFAKPLKLNPMFPEAFSILAQFLKQNKRSIKIHTLILLEKVFRNYIEYCTKDINEEIVKQMVPLISESDLYISQLALAALTAMIMSHKAFHDIIPQRILPEALVLIRSPLMQGSTLMAMLDFFRAIVKSSFPGLDYNELIARLTQPIMQPNQQLHKQAYYSISKCIAAISLLNDKYAASIVSNLIEQIRNPMLVTGNGSSGAQNESVQLYSLLTIAEIGKSLDLEQLQQPLQDALIQSFNSSHEEVKSAASICLGSVSMGNLERNLSFILSEISNNPKRQYLFLNALKEIVSCLSVDHQKICHLEPHFESIVQLLIKYAQCDEEGARYVVAECLGKLTLLKPANLLPVLLENLRNGSTNIRETIITSIRFAIADCSPQAEYFTMLKQLIGAYIETLNDKDINVRRVAFITLNSILHNKASLIRDFLGQVFPMLYQETHPKPEYVREVEMGPFKHTVDDGLDLRKAVFECMYTLLDSCLDKVEIFEYLNNVELGLKDTYDIKMLTYLILIRLSDLCPSAILQRLENIVGLLKETCFAKLKSNAVKQEFEKQDELRRSAIRAFVAIYRIRDADKDATANELMNAIKTMPELQNLYQSVMESNKIINELLPSMEVDFN